MADVVRLGGAPAPLELVIKRRSLQAFAMEVSTDAGPLIVQGAVRLELEDTTAPDAVLIFPGVPEGSTITWTLTEEQSDLPFGRRWASLIMLPLSGSGRTVWARGQAWIR